MHKKYVIALYIRLSVEDFKTPVSPLKLAVSKSSLTEINRVW